MVMYHSNGLINAVLVVLSRARPRALRHVLLLLLRTGKRVLHAEYTETNRYPVQETQQAVSPAPCAESHPRCIDSAGPDRGGPACHYSIGETAQTRGELSP